MFDMKAGLLLEYGKRLWFTLGVYGCVCVGERNCSVMCVWCVVRVVLWCGVVWCGVVCRDLLVWLQTVRGVGKVPLQVYERE